MARDETSLARTTKRIGSLRYFINHRGTSKKTFGTASDEQVEARKRQLAHELELREALKAGGRAANLGTDATIQAKGQGAETRSYPVSARDGSIDHELAAKSVGDLLGLSRTILRELRGRGVIRSGNAPAGDYAEVLVQRATCGELAPSSQKSWDVLAATGERLQVKARIVTDPMNPGERQLSVFRSLGLRWSRHRPL